jgi:glucose-1-phosphate cytidylyltransferase
MKETNIDQFKWAVILCGGKGSRLGDITDKTPKPLVEVHDKPIMWYTFWTLYNHGFRNFILPLGYKGEMIEKYFRNISADTGSNIFSIDTGIDTSIAHRMDKVCKYIPDNKDFFILNSDTLFEFDIEGMYQLHKKKNALVTLSSVDVISTWGLIMVNDDKVIGFERERKVRHLFAGRGKEEGLVYSGFSWINKKALSIIDLHTCFDFETNVYQCAIDLDRSAHYPIDGLWFPIDTLKDLQIINMMNDDRHSLGYAAKNYKTILEEKK